MKALRNVSSPVLMSFIFGKMYLLEFRSALCRNISRGSAVGVRAVMTIRGEPAVQNQQGCEGDHEVRSGRDEGGSEPYPPGHLVDGRRPPRERHA